MMRYKMFTSLTFTALLNIVASTVSFVDDSERYNTFLIKVMGITILLATLINVLLSFIMFLQ